MAQLMDLKIDFAFKQIFGTVGNEPILIAFLNAALPLTLEEQIDFGRSSTPNCRETRWRTKDRC
ncbi:MAG: PD-(D/E)XK nuclease family transposase [Tumebacillaceae bacterium]